MASACAPALAIPCAHSSPAVATINSTVWLLAASMSWWRLVVATTASVTLVVAWLVIDGELWDRPDDEPGLMGGYLNTSLGYDDMFVLAWFVASAATVGGGLGTGLESDEAIRAAAYSKREEERRTQLARDRT